MVVVAGRHLVGAGADDRADFAPGDGVVGVIHTVGEARGDAAQATPGSARGVASVGRGGQRLPRGERGVGTAAIPRPYAHLQPQGGAIKDVPEVQLDSEVTVGHLHVLHRHHVPYLIAIAQGIV